VVAFAALIKMQRMQKPCRTFQQGKIPVGQAEPAAPTTSGFSEAPTYLTCPTILPDLSPGKDGSPFPSEADSVRGVAVEQKM